jgi:hypothetical protein
VAKLGGSFVVEDGLRESRFMYNGERMSMDSLGEDMEEQELPLIQITQDDIAEANRLSLHCPMCAGAVENHVDDEALRPVFCASCKTLYHKACWEQGGGKCAILGCDHDKYIVHGTYRKPILTISKADLPVPSPNGRKPGRRTRRLKEQQRRQVEQLRRPSLLRRLWQWLLDQITIG